MGSVAMVHGLVALLQVESSQTRDQILVTREVLYPHILSNTKFSVLISALGIT